MNNPPKPEKAHIHLSAAPGAVCPSCGRFVGAYERCPFCQASLSMRMSLKLVRRVALIGSVVGLIAVYFAARYHEIPLVKVSDFQISNNMALVKVKGSVAELRDDQGRNNLKMVIDDGTGHITLNVFGKSDVFRRALGDKFPQEGDTVEAVGNLSISEKWGNSMFLTTPKRLKVLEKAISTEINLKDINNGMVSKQIWVTAQVVEAVKFKSGYTITMKDQTGEMPLTVFDSELTQLADDTRQEELLLPGSVFKMKIKVDSYRDKLQLRLVDTDAKSLEYQGNKALPSNAADLKEAKITALGDVPMHKPGNELVVKARVTEIHKIEGIGRSLTLNDDTGEETMFLYDSTAKQVKDIERLDAKNTVIKAKVKIDSYKGKRQLIPVAPDAVQVMEVDK